MQEDTMQEFVVNHALESEKNLEVACLVRSSFDGIQRRAIACFLEKLEIDLKASLGDRWNIKNDLIRDPLHSHVELQVWKNHWLNNCAVVLSPDSSGARDFYVGWRKIQQATEVTPAVEGELRTSLEKAYGSVKGAPNWGLWWYVKQSYRNWQYDDPSAFVDMYFHTDNIVSYFKEHIIRWTEIVSPIVDKAFSPGQ